VPCTCASGESKQKEIFNYYWHEKLKFNKFDAGFLLVFQRVFWVLPECLNPVFNQPVSSELLRVSPDPNNERFGIAGAVFTGFSFCSSNSAKTQKSKTFT